MTNFYISGKITDGEKETPNFDFFYEAEEMLKKREGCEKIFNPARLELDSKTWEEYLTRDLMWISDNKPTMYFLPNWKESRGARLEHEWAKSLGLPIEYESN